MLNRRVVQCHKFFGAIITTFTPPIILFFTFSLLFAFFNGFNNSGALVAAPISTRSVSPRVAVALAIAAEFAGPFLFGAAVAATIGQDFVVLSALNLDVLVAATAAVSIWNIVTWFFGLPSSSSHALAGGLIGAVWAGAGLDAFKLAGLLKILGALFLAPMVGLLGGYLLLKFILLLLQGATPGVNIFFRNLQALTTVALALSHGTNDGQKSMGLLTLGLVVMGAQPNFVVPRWATLVSAAALALGVSAGGYRIIRTLGGKIYPLRAVHGFTSQAASAAIVLASTLLGAPVSTTQIVGTAIMGVGAAERARGVRWEVASQIVMAWLITIPAVALGAALLYWLLRAIGV